MQTQISIVSESDDGYVLHVRIPKGKNFVQSEEHIQEALTEARKLAAGMFLKGASPQAEAGSAIDASDAPTL